MNTHEVTIAGIRRDLPIVSVSPTVSIAFLKLYGDQELVDAAADALAAKLLPETEAIVGPESGGILLAHLVSARTGLPYVIVRKKRRPHMVRPFSVDVSTIASDQPQKLWLDDLDQVVLHNKGVAVVDEVVSSGATLRAVTELVTKSGGTVTQVLAVASEGDADSAGLHTNALCHLPLFVALP